MHRVVSCIINGLISGRHAGQDGAAEEYGCIIGQAVDCVHIGRPEYVINTAEHWMRLVTWFDHASRCFTSVTAVMSYPGFAKDLLAEPAASVP